MKTLTKTLLIIIITIGIIARFLLLLNLKNKIPEFFNDYGRDLLIAKHISQFKNKDNLFIAPASASVLLKNTPVYYWLLGIFYYSFNSKFGVHYFFFLISCIQIFLAYKIGQKNSQIIGLTFASLVAASMPFISLSNSIWQPHLLPFFILLAINFLVYYFFKKKLKFLLFYAASITAAISLHYSSFILLPSAILIGLFIIKKTKLTKTHYFYLLSFISFGLAINSKLANLSSLEENSYFSIKKVQLIKNILPVDISTFTRTYDALSRMNSNLLNLPLFITLALFVIILIYCKKRGKNWFLILIYSFLPFIFLFLSPIKLIHDHYLICLYPLIIFYPIFFLTQKNKYFCIVGLLMTINIISHNSFILWKKFKENAFYNYDHSQEYKKLCQIISAHSELHNKNISAIYSIDQFCLSQNEQSKNYKSCILSEWNSAGVWDELERQTKKKLTILIKYGSNIESLYKHRQNTINYLICIPNKVNLCKNVTNLVPEYVKIASIPDISGNNNIIIYSDEK